MCKHGFILHKLAERHPLFVNVNPALCQRGLVQSDQYIGQSPSDMPTGIVDCGLDYSWLYVTTYTFGHNVTAPAVKVHGRLSCFETCAPVRLVVEVICILVITRGFRLQWQAKFMIQDANNPALTFVPLVLSSVSSSMERGPFFPLLSSLPMKAESLQQQFPAL